MALMARGAAMTMQNPLHSYEPAQARHGAQRFTASWETAKASSCNRRKPDEDEPTLWQLRWREGVHGMQPLEQACVCVAERSSIIAIWLQYARPGGGPGQRSSCHLRQR